MMNTKSLKLLNEIAQAIYDKKGMNILALDVRGISTMADYFVIAEGNVDRHVRALSGAIKDAMQTHQIRPLHCEGEQSGDWIVLDFGEIVVHLFVPELREKYALEELWNKSKIVDVNIRIGHEK